MYPVSCILYLVSCIGAIVCTGYQIHDTRHNNMFNNDQKNTVVKKILIIEDDIIVQTALQAKLKVAGFDFMGAATGEEALDILEREQFDLIIIDVILPDMDGFDILKKIKQDPDTRHVPLVVVSNLSEEEMLNKGPHMGDKDYIVPPVGQVDKIVGRVVEVFSDN